MVTPRDTSPFGSAGVGEEHRVDQLISLDVQQRETATVLTVRGEVDMVTTPHLRAGLHERLQARPDLLVLDLTRLSFLGSSGLAVLVETLETSREQGTTLRLVCNSHEVLRPLEATGLTELFQTYQDLDAALAG
ncbi:MAG: STAS domain-containing protein [Pseudonocardiaceae bacterium]